MRKLMSLIVAGMILSAPAAVAKIEVRTQVDELAEKVAKPEKSKKRVVAKPKGPAAKVDNFVDKNNDGVDDRRQKRFVRPEEVRKSDAPKRDEPKPRPAPRKVDSTDIKRVKPR